MATSDAGTELTERHRRRILSVRAATLREIERLWPSWSVADSGSFDPFARAATNVTIAGHNAAARVSADYWQAYRVAEVGESTAPVIAEPLDRERLFGWLRQQGLGGTIRALRSGRTMDAAREVGFVDLSGASGQMVTKGEQDTVLGSAIQDPQAQGWSRTTSTNPCAFCALQASRGPVYRSQSTADFRPHKACACGVEPVFDRDNYEWPGRSREFRRMYEEATNVEVPDTSGMSITDAMDAINEAYDSTIRGTSNDLLNAFRRAYDAT